MRSQGSEGQIFAGLAMTFVMLLFYQRSAPYINKGHRHVGFAAALVLFLFFLVALMLNAGIQARKTLFFSPPPPSCLPALALSRPSSFGSNAQNSWK